MKPFNLSVVVLIACLCGMTRAADAPSTQPAERTTPEAPDLEKLFKQVVDAGWEYAVMEVSSHAIEMKRVQELRFEIAVFTNLSRDHLDFHGDMESYFRVKKKLFEGLNEVRPRVMVLN